MFQKPLQSFFESEILFGTALFRKILCKPADIRGYGHFVIVENYYQIKIFAVTIVQRFKNHSVRERTVPHNADDIIVFAVHSVRFRKAQPRRNGISAVTASEWVVFAFGTACKARYSAFFAEFGHFFVSARQYLVNIRLMSDVEYYLICGSVKSFMYSDRQFNDTEVGSKMSARFSDRFYQCFANLRTKLCGFGIRHFFHVGRGFYLFEDMRSLPFGYICVFNFIIQLCFCQCKYPRKPHFLKEKQDLGQSFIGNLKILPVISA